MSFFWTVRIGSNAKTCEYVPASDATGSRPYSKGRFVEIDVADVQVCVEDIDCLHAFVESLKQAIAHLEGKG